MTTYPTLTLERRGEIGLARLAPDALRDNDQMMTTARALRGLGEDSTLRVLVLHAAPAPLPSFHAAADLADPLAASRRVEAEIALARALIDLPMPVIAAITGDLLDHAEIALSADLIVAADHVRFGDTRWRRGAPPAGAAASLWQVVLGSGRAGAVLLGLRTIGAAEAVRIGFVHAVAPESEVELRAMELATRLAAQPDLALRGTRKTMTRRLRERIDDDAAFSLSLSAVALLGAQGWRPASPAVAANAK